ncbi:endopeptidase La [Tautonia sociabilis]|uniref:Lon protease n=1 Tax=Tautonia sociabilis TaxID=2080755 RepID=A0A432MF08_9BACT|nr:endopeptidase La [Tautonia sociabilis]RUL84330.1 endopeptidase La [Tautonia sociabilis]
MSKRKSKANPRPDPSPSPGEPPADGRALAVPTIEEAGPSLPGRMPILPLRADVVFPQTVVPLVVNRPAGMRLIDEVYAAGGDRIIGLATQRSPELDEPGPAELYPTLCVGSILKMLKFPDGSTRIVCQGIARARLIGLEQTEPYLIGRVEPLGERAEQGEELDALVHLVNGLFNRLSENVPEELQVAAMNTRDPARLADLLGSSLPFSVEEKQAMLAELDVKARLMTLGQFLTRHLNVMELSTKIQAQVGSEITRAQREHFLRQQLKAIQEELGEREPEAAEARELERKIRRAKLPPEARAEARREIDRLAGMHPSSAEYSIVRTYVDWLASLPWARSSTDHLDLKRARQILDEDHFDLEKIKERILEYLAVRKLKKDMKGPILCFAGPPGTGKTSLGRSIARAMGREFVRISLGGVHDEAEIRGHRRTYVAALPGRIIQGLRKAGTNNPVFMLDEVDKLGADFRGDPSAALLEVLDPEQNATFRDNYLDIDFDLSKIMFIATANMLESIPQPLLDRMEVLELPGYAEEEKVLIAQRFLIPKQLESHGLTEKHLTIGDDAVRRIISDYTREAGLRNLERELAAICRKVARKRAEGKKGATAVGADDVPSFLGPPKHFREVAARTGVPGVATGLAWTPTGGEILFIEATGMPGKGALTLTGLLGESMKESAQAAMSYLKTHARQLGIDPARFAKTDVHIHVPAGAVPKDGPSAGVAIASALISLFRDEPVRRDLAMTGELTLTGRVLPVGGVKEKVLGARRAGIKSVLLPRYNEKDLTDLPEEVREDLTFRGVESLDDVVAALFPEPRRRASRSKSGTSRAARGSKSKGSGVPGRAPR